MIVLLYVIILLVRAQKYERLFEQIVIFTDWLLFQLVSLRYGTYLLTAYRLILREFLCLIYETNFWTLGTRDFLSRRVIIILEHEKHTRLLGVTHDVLFVHYEKLKLIINRCKNDLKVY